MKKTEYSDPYKGDAICLELTVANLSRLRAILLDCHGEIKEWMEDFPLHALSGNPLDQLIGTVLSQATNDRNSSRAFANLKTEYPDWEDALAAPAVEVERAIACGGLGKQKSLKIQAILARLSPEGDGLTLDHLRSLAPAETRRFLLSLPGVGPKTAACVQLFSLGQSAFPVDTHVHRVISRLCLVPKRIDAAKTQALLEETAAADDCLPLHLALIQHGRRICRPANPDCPRCPLKPECLYEKIKEPEVAISTINH